MPNDRPSQHGLRTIRDPVGPSTTATRFAARAWLDKKDLQWAHLVLAVGDGQGEQARQTLGPDQAETQINIPLRDRDLVIQLEEGLNGPIRDRLRLSNAAVLVPTE